MLRAILFVLPLGLDTFAIAAALGLARLPVASRLRVSALMAGFEMLMPVVGLLLGSALGHAVGTAADYLAIAVLVGVGATMLREDEDGETERLEQFVAARGAASVGLGLSVSLDELTIGFSIGLLRISIWIAMLLIGAQAFLLSQLGLRLGARIGRRAGEVAGRLAGIGLIGLAVLLMGERIGA